MAAWHCLHICFAFLGCCSLDSFLYEVCYNVCGSILKHLDKYLK